MDSDSKTYRSSGSSSHSRSGRRTSGEGRTNGGEGRSRSGENKNRGLHRKSSAYKDKERGKKFFYASLAVSSFWFLINIFKFYKSPILAIVIKVLWLPMLIILFLIPIICLLLIVKKKFNPRSFYLYSLILCFITMIFVAIVS